MWGFQHPSHVLVIYYHRIECGDHRSYSLSNAGEGVNAIGKIKE